MSHYYVHLSTQINAKDSGTSLQIRVSDIKIGGPQIVSFLGAEEKERTFVSVTLNWGKKMF